MDSNTKIWDSVLQNVREKLGPLRYNLWFKNTRLESFDDKSVNILVPNVFTQVWLQDNFSNLLREDIGRVVNNRDLDVRFSIDTAREKVDKDKNADSSTEKKPTGSPHVENTGKNTPYKESARTLKLENFVVGPNNRLAYTAALEMVKDTFPSFNPLFIHGPVGVGKTHLLTGIYNRVKEEKHIQAAYMPAEKWTNEFVYSLQKGKMEAFRQKYRNVDVLLVDDVHFLANKQGVQEEFLHTYNALFGLSKKIILASDAHPKMIGQLKENLSSRFMSGMVAKIDKPLFTTRLLILRTKAAKYDVHFSEEVLEFIAEKFTDSIREVESALITLTAHAKFNKKKIDLELAKETLSEFYCDTGKMIKVNEIEAVVMSHFNITRTELHSSKKTKAVAFPRQISMYLIKTLLDWSYQQIGSYFGRKKHSTVVFAIKKIKEQIESDKQFKSFIEMLLEKIRKQ